MGDENDGEAPLVPNGLITRSEEDAMADEIRAILLDSGDFHSMCRSAFLTATNGNLFGKLGSYQALQLALNSLVCEAMEVDCPLSDEDAAEMYVEGLTLAEFHLLAKMYLDAIVRTVNTGDETVDANGLMPATQLEHK